MVDSMNTGQVCCAGTRIFVQEGIYDKFLAALSEAAKYWDSVTGDPFSAKTQMGPIVSKIQIDVRVFLSYQCHHVAYTMIFFSEC